MALSFWTLLDHLVKESSIVIDRPKGTAHPRYPDDIFPYDYGYLAGTTSGDGQGIDVWLGSLPDNRATAIICTIDLAKRDSEMKILLGCTQEEMQVILRKHRIGLQSAVLIERPAEEGSQEAEHSLER